MPDAFHTPFHFYPSHPSADGKLSIPKSNHPITSSLNLTQAPLPHPIPSLIQCFNGLCTGSLLCSHRSQ